MPFFPKTAGQETRPCPATGPFCSPLSSSQRSLRFSAGLSHAESCSACFQRLFGAICLFLKCTPHAVGFFWSVPCFHGPPVVLCFLLELFYVSFFLNLCEVTVCSLSIPSVFPLHFFTSPSYCTLSGSLSCLLFSIFLMLLFVTLHICRLYAIFLPSLRLLSSFRPSFSLSGTAELVWGLSQPLHFLLGLSKTAVAAFQAFGLFRSLTEVTLEHFQSFCSFFIIIPHFSEVNWVFLGCFSLSSRFMAFQQLLFLSPGTGQGGSLQRCSSFKSSRLQLHWSWNRSLSHRLEIFFWSPFGFGGSWG